MSNYKTVFVGLEYTIVVHTWNYTVIPESEKKSITWKIVIDDKETDLKETGESIKYKFKREQQGKKIIFKAFDKSKENHTVVLVYVSKCNVAPSWQDENGNKIEKTPYGRVVQFELLFQNYFAKDSIRFTVILENEDKSFSKEVFTTGDIGCEVINNKTGIRFEIKDEWRVGPKESLCDLYLSVKVEDICSFDRGCFFGHDDIYRERLLIKDFFVDDEGFVINPRVEVMSLPSYGRKGTPNIFNKNNPVKAIVLHRTDGETGESAYNTANSSDNQGGHFTIEGDKAKEQISLSGEDGAIYQFASLKKAVNHVGSIRKRPALNTPKLKWRLATLSSLAEESKKNYPERFPYNGDSIGIEVVGKVIPDSVRNGGWEAKWEELTNAQILNTSWLVKGLLSHFSLDAIDDIYVHEQISSKTWDEGGTVLRAIKPYLK